MAGREGGRRMDREKENQGGRREGRRTGKEWSGVEVRGGRHIGTSYKGHPEIRT